MLLNPSLTNIMNEQDYKDEIKRKKDDLARTEAARLSLEKTVVEKDAEITELKTAAASSEASAESGVVDAAKP